MKFMVQRHGFSSLDRSVYTIDLVFASTPPLRVPNQGRLETIIDLIEQSNFSVHDLSRIELSRGIPRFNMPVEASPFTDHE
jgi:hypothetical protein